MGHGHGHGQGKPIYDTGIYTGVLFLDAQLISPTAGSRTDFLRHKRSPTFFQLINSREKERKRKE